MTASGPCEYCSRSGDRISGPEDGLNSDLFVCAQCMALLRDPKVGLQLVRGNLTLALRGTGQDRDVKKRINQFMDMLSLWRRRD